MRQCGKEIQHSGQIKHLCFSYFKPLEQKESLRIIYVSFLFCSRFFVGSWLWSSFLLTASYGGELRAFILAPEFSGLIDSFPEAVDSGMRRKLVDYGDGMYEVVSEG